MVRKTYMSLHLVSTCFMKLFGSLKNLRNNQCTDSGPRDGGEESQWSIRGLTRLVILLVCASLYLSARNERQAWQQSQFRHRSSGESHCFWPCFRSVALYWARTAICREADTRRFTWLAWQYLRTSSLLDFSSFGVSISCLSEFLNSPIEDCRVLRFQHTGVE